MQTAVAERSATPPDFIYRRYAAVANARLLQLVRVLSNPACTQLPVHARRARGADSANHLIPHLDRRPHPESQ